MRFTARLREPEKLSAGFKSLTLPLSGGYEEGYTDGHAAGYTKGEAAGIAQVEEKNAAVLTDCNAVLPDKGVETADSLEQVPQRIGKIVVEKDFSRYAGEIKFPNLNLFGQKDVVVNLDTCYYANALFRASVQNTTVEHLTVNCPTPLQTIGSMFYFMSGAQDFTLKHLTLNLNMAASNYNTTWLYYANALEVVDGTPLDFSGTTTGNIEYVGCNNLREIRFVPLSIKRPFWFGGSSKLSDESVQSIIDGLADLTGATAQHLTLHATVGGKLTEEQREVIAAKNWTLVY